MCNQLKICETQPVSSANFCHFLITSCSREKTLLYHTASDGKPGGEAASKAKTFSPASF